MSDQSNHLEALAALAHPDGGWGYAPGQAAHLEPTCLALLALSADAPRFQKNIDSGWAFLDQCACGDGTYRLKRGRPEAVWPTALVLFVQASLGRVPEEVERTAAALLSRRGRQTAEAGGEEVNDIDLDLVGWPWAENTFSWVEPTAWACLALRRAGQGEHPRVLEGRKLLLDRALEQGGVNYGNRRIFGVSLESIPGPTALMLLALQNGPEEPRVTAAVESLRRQATEGEDLEHLCWARLALDAYQDHPGITDSLAQLDARIRAAHAARAETPWLRPAPLRLALTAFALNAGRVNPFRLAPCETPRPLLHPAPLASPRPPSLGERIRAGLEGLLIRTETYLRPLDPQSRVHIVPAGDYNADLADVVRRQYEEFRERVPLKGKRVVLKPNLVEYHRDKVINTHPNVVAAAIELCRREGAAEVLVAEGPGHWRNAEHLVAASGLGDVLRHYKVRFIDLNTTSRSRRPTSAG